MDKSALSRATDSSTAPTPGYLYNDIGKTLNSPQTCIETLNYLISRLSKNNPHIKKKCLKVLSKICAHPTSRGMMKRSVVQNPNAIAAIKECMAYRGTIDAVTGDQYNVEVREAAKECLEVVYSDAGDAGPQSNGGGGFGGGQLQGGGMAGLGANSNANSSSMGGYGSSNAGQGGGGYGAPMGGHSGSGVPSTSASSSRMEGIGNPNFADPRLQQQDGSKLGQLGEMASSVGGAMLEMIKDPLAKNVVQPGHPGMGSGGYNPNARPDPYAQPPPGRNNLAMQTEGQWTMASNRGPNAVGSAANSVPEPPSNHQNSEYYKAKNAQGGQAFSWAANPPAPSHSAPNPAAPPSGVGGSWASAAPVATSQPPSQMSIATQARQPPASANVASAVAITGTPSSNGFKTGGGDYEKNLILELCPPGGMKAEPPQDKLEEFANAIPSLNPDLVCPALLDALEEGNPWIMRAKALCVIETVLKVESARSGDGGTQAYTDFFYECSGEIQPLASHARASVKGPAKRVLTILGVDGTSMNGGEVTSNAAESAAAAPPTNLLDFDEPTPVTETAPVDNTLSHMAASSGGDSLFSGLNTKAGSLPTTADQQPVAASPVAPPPPPQQPQQDDIFGGMTVSGATPAVVAPTTLSSGNDLFGSMDIKSADDKIESATSTAEPTGNAPSGSAFGFMNATPSSPVPPPPAQATPASPTNTFDPLLSMGNGNTTGNNMTSSPNPNNNMAQMQQMQMAYQQNMMMMQMQQMQMAQQSNFQRQGSGGMPPMPPNMQMMPTSSPLSNNIPKQPIMGANYMRQVPNLSGDKSSSFSFLGDQKKQERNKSFDFVQDELKKK